MSIELEINKPKVELFLPHGNRAEILFKAYKKQVEKHSIKDWDCVSYNPATKQVYGASHISQGVFNYIAKDFGYEVALNEDNAFGDVSSLISGKYYSEYNSLCVHSEKPKYERNNSLWKKAMEIGEEKFGSVKNKFRINGFYYLPDESEKSYGVKIIPAYNFSVIEDESLTLNNGLSGFLLGRLLSLCSGGGNLAGSDSCGRVVLKKSRSDASQKS
jgi:hypothetical protein